MMVRIVFVIAVSLTVSTAGFSQIATPAPAVVAGRLVSSEGTAIAGVRVIALETAYPRLNIAGQAETDNDGRYRLENLPAGEYFIVADPFKIPSYYPGTGNRDESSPVSVAAGVVRSDVDFKFVRSSGVLRAIRTRSLGQTRLSGVLYDTKGKGLQNFTVMLSSTNATLWTVTNSSGAFEFLSLTAGEFSLDTAGSGRLRRSTTADNTSRGRNSRAGHRRQAVLGNSQLRPDLYGPGDLRERDRLLRRSGPGEPSFWRCQNLDSQARPEYSEAMRAANLKGSVTLQINVDPTGKVFRLRIASSNTNSDLARAAMKAVSQWRLTPLKWVYAFARNTVSCAGEGETQEFQGTVTIDFPPA